MGEHINCLHRKYFRANCMLLWIPVILLFSNSGSRSSLMPTMEGKNMMPSEQDKGNHWEAREETCENQLLPPACGLQWDVHLRLWVSSHWPCILPSTRFLNILPILTSLFISAVYSYVFYFSFSNPLHYILWHPFPASLTLSISLSFGGLLWCWWPNELEGYLALDSYFVVLMFMFIQPPRERQTCFPVIMDLQLPSRPAWCMVLAWLCPVHATCVYPMSLPLVKVNVLCDWVFQWFIFPGILSKQGGCDFLGLWIIS